MNGPALFAIPGTLAGGADPESSHVIEEAVRDAFDELEEAGALGPIERAKRAALVAAAAGLDRGLSAAKVTVATSTVLKQVLEGLDTLPRPVAGTDVELDALGVTMAALTASAFERTDGQ